MEIKLEIPDNITEELSITLTIGKKNKEEIPEESVYMESPEEQENSEEQEICEKPTSIDLKALQFEKELEDMGIYDVDMSEDELLPPRRALSNDDVEIITDTYEKEMEDVMEGRRP